ncbi:CocE/NonD family hydrolase C-terminal non-catalytic domain-containing protein, partial [Sphaerisporangium sp. NPDC049003]|uniref:CocE/NonD family hydrolase C-terminal non-catalytic domain-containing protein n=1 Tax=Sphaerisporangium sp. NPDC049003 TaxID=3364517 RepID=UPI0037127C3E
LGQESPGRGSPGHGHDRIAVPTMLVAGWADGYANVVPRLSASLERGGVPYRVIAGPWSHASPDHALPGPGIELLPEMVRWWDRWLRGDRDAAPGRSAVVFVRSSTPPAPDRATVNGEFRALPGWPALPERPWPLTTRKGAAWRDLPTDPDIGIAVWNNCAGSLPWGQALDQRSDDARSVTVEWESPAEGLTIVGHPRLRASVRTGAGGTLAVRLCDVAPDGASELISRAILRLPGVSEPQSDSEADSPAKVGSEAGSPAQAGSVAESEESGAVVECEESGAVVECEESGAVVEREESGAVVEVEVEVELDVVAHRVVPGHRLRLALATSEWPNVMASPEPVPVAVDLAGSALLLPLAEGPLGEPASGLRRTEAPVPDATDVVWTIDHDVLQRVTRCRTGYGSAAEPLGGGTYADRYEGEVTLDHRTRRQTVSAQSRFHISWADGPAVTAESRLKVATEGNRLTVTVEVTATENGTKLMTRRWTRHLDR